MHLQTEQRFESGYLIVPTEAMTTILLVSHEFLLKLSFLDNHATFHWASTQVPSPTREVESPAFLEHPLHLTKNCIL